MTCEAPFKQNTGRRKQSGQFMLEAILLMVLFLGIATAIKKSFAEKNIISTLVAGPWSQISGMMSNGVWRPEAQGRDLHPQGSVMSREGDVN